MNRYKTVLADLPVGTRYDDDFFHAWAEWAAAVEEADTGGKFSNLLYSLTGDVQPLVRCRWKQSAYCLGSCVVWLDVNKQLANQISLQRARWSKTIKERNGWKYSRVSNPSRLKSIKLIVY